MALLIAYVMLALGVSFLCSIMEAVLLSITPSFIEMKAKDGSNRAEKLYALKTDIDRPLAAILSLNTVAHTVGAAGAGAQAANVFGDAAIGIFSGILTLLILVFSEIVPKTLGVIYWRQLAMPITSLLIPTIWITWPLVKLSQAITRLLSPAARQDSISREEITAMAELGEEQGLLAASESRIIQNLFRFSSLRVKDIMTPRIVVVALPETLTVQEVVDEHHEFRFSRIPIYTETRDDVTGYVLKDDILLKAAQDKGGITLHDLKRDMLVVPDALPLHELFERMLDRLEHIALVVDEYGGVGGVVSMEDVVETILGLEIVDEVDSAEDMQHLARRQWLSRAQRLGIIPRELENARAEEFEKLLKYGITGGATGGADKDAGRDEDEEDDVDRDVPDKPSSTRGSKQPKEESTAERGRER